MPDSEVSSSGSGIKGTLTKRVGPLPVWGWGAVVAGGVVVFIILRKRTTAGATGTQQQDIGFGSSTGGGGGSGGVIGGHDDIPAGGSGPTIPVGQQQPDTAPLRTIASTGGLRIAGGNPAVGIANAIGQTVASLGAQVGQQAVSGGVVRTAISDATQAQKVVQSLTSRGYTSGYYGGSVYTGKTPQSFFAGLPEDARNNLAKLLVAQSKVA